MRLRELLQFDHIVVQCHDNPDADAIASGYGLLLFLRSHQKNVRLVYGGKPIQKSNLVLMTLALGIPITCVQDLEEEPDLLVTVDCQYGEKNVRRFSGKTIAVIDHHKPRPETLPAMREVRDHYGACATLIWDMLIEEGFDPGENERLSTALYYGLFMDTNKFQELRHPKDKDLRDALEFKCNKGKLFQMQNCNLSLEELNIVGQAFENYDYCPEYRFAVSRAERCDPNILGVISDMLMEVDVVDTCIAYCMLDDGAKLSVRSCTKKVRANELTEYIAEGLGSGGGHPQKSGGFLRGDLLWKECQARFGFQEQDMLDAGVHRILMSRMETYFCEQEFVYNGTDSVPNLSCEPRYRKRRLPIGYVRATDIYPENTTVTVRMLEGDITLTIKADTYFIIGIEADVYTNEAKYFWAHNDAVDQPYQFQGEYAPTIRTSVQTLGLTDSAEGKSLVAYAKTCIPKDGPTVYARQLTRRTKVFVSWSDDYMLGNPGDWLIAREENPRDVYIVKKDIFEKTYELCV